MQFCTQKFCTVYRVVFPLLAKTDSVTQLVVMTHRLRITGLLDKSRDCAFDWQPLHFVSESAIFYLPGIFTGQLYLI